MNNVLRATPENEAAGSGAEPRAVGEAAPSRRAHWERVYRGRAATELSWYEARPDHSRALISAAGLGPDDPILDVGGGASLLADALVAAGHTDVTVLDVSATALERVRERLGARGASVRLLEADVTDFVADRRYALWHDRAVFHFLTDAADRARYRRAVEGAVAPGGHVILATFARTGPLRCSGLDVVRYDPSQLAAELGPRLDLVESFTATHVTPGCVDQPFVYCRFRLRAAPARDANETGAAAPEATPRP